MCADRKMYNLYKDKMYGIEYKFLNKLFKSVLSHFTSLIGLRSVNEIKIILSELRSAKHVSLEIAHCEQGMKTLHQALCVFSLLSHSLLAFLLSLTALLSVPVYHHSDIGLQTITSFLLNKLLILTLKNNFNDSFPLTTERQ